MPFLRLCSRFLFRALVREKMRNAVAIAGVALGVAVMVAIRLANVSVTETFSAAVDSVSGNASLRIVGPAGRFDEKLFDDLEWLQEFGHRSPVIETYAMVGKPAADRESGGDGFPRGELLHVLGVDVLLDFPLRDYQVLRVASEDSQSPREALQLLSDSRSVILTEKFLRRQGLRVGDQLPLTFGTTTRDYRIRGVLLNTGPATTLDGNFALMDIAAAQLAADRLGKLDQIDVLLDADLDVDDTVAAIRKRLPPELVLEMPDADSGRANTMITAFQFNLASLSAVALVVGLFLIYNTVAMSVAARRREIGMLQAIGAGRRTVLALFLVEAFVLAGIGLLIGLPAGRLLGSAAVTATAQTVETFYIAAIAQSSASALRLSAAEIFGATCVVMPLALLAAFVPAWEAASVQPVEASRGSGVRLSSGIVRRLALMGVASFAVGWALTLVRPIGGLPVAGFAAEMVFMLGGALLTPFLIRAVCRLGRSIARKSDTRFTELRIAASNLDYGLARVSVSVAALGISLAMMIAIAIMVGSFRETVVYWLDSSLSADLAVKPVMQTSSVSEARLSPEAIDAVTLDPDVEETLWFSSRQVPYRGRNIRLAVTEIQKTIDRGRLIFKQSPEADAFQRVRSNDRPLLVSESFSLLFHVDVGEQVVLNLPQGENAFRVAGVYYDYASNQGTVMMDAADHGLYFGESGSVRLAQHLSVYLKEDAPADSVRKRILQQAGENELIYCATSAEVRREALKIFESTFAVTYALQMIAILVAGLGVATTLIALIYQSQKDIGLLGLIGATGAQIRRIVVYEALMIGLASQLIGIAVGVILAMVLIYVINVQSFGWTIQFHFPYLFVAQSTACVLIASALFGLYPAVRAASVDALATVREQNE